MLEHAWKGKISRTHGDGMIPKASGKDTGPWPAPGFKGSARAADPSSWEEAGQR